jgi:YHS domain-containing protein
MTSADFTDRLESRLASARRRDAERSHHEEQAMRERSDRLALLDREGARLHREIIRPRVTALAEGLDAVLEHYRSPHGYQSYVRCHRSAGFPATARLGLGVEWNPEGTEAWLVCNVEIVPVLMALPGDARLPLSWEGPNREQAAEWVEDRIMLFLEACLELMRDPAYQQDRLRSDPVCGMRVSQDLAASSEFNGRRYYFCSESCQARFADEPALYTLGLIPVEGA